MMWKLCRYWFPAIKIALDKAHKTKFPIKPSTITSRLACPFKSEFESKEIYPLSWHKRIGAISLAVVLRRPSWHYVPAKTFENKRLSRDMSLLKRTCRSISERLLSDWRDLLRKRSVIAAIRYSSSNQNKLPFYYIN